MEKGGNYDNTAAVATAFPMQPPGAHSSVVVPPGNASSVPIWQQEKQGAKCCGCCCDYRRAVIVLAIITICVNLGYLIVALTAATIPTTTSGGTLDDDVVMGIYEDTFRIQAIFAGISLVAAICALVGANKFSIPLVAINTVWYVGNLVAGTIISINLINDMGEAATDDYVTISPYPTIAVNVILTCIYMYPHIGFMYEVKKGIMSFETYPREEYSCCCAPRARG